MSVPAPLRVYVEAPQALADAWGLSLDFARRLLVMDTEGGDLGLSIVSGHRSCEQQEALRQEGRTGLRCCACTYSGEACSTHTTSPATGADLGTTPTPVPAVKARFGAAAVFAGLRWGGGSPVDPDTGIPSDWNHVDLGRASGAIPCLPS